jgi:hypothetical protein
MGIRGLSCQCGLLVLGVALGLACGDRSDSPTGSAGPEGSGQNDEADVSAGTGHDDGSPSCDYDVTQGVSQPCCTEHGIDACGAGLFCAAFDGRTQATCYPEHSRGDLEECLSDVHCVSGECDEDAGVCRSSPLTACDDAVGCARDPTGRRYVCRPKDAGWVCDPIGDGEALDVCETNADCNSGSCNDEKKTCRSDWYDSCADDSDCINGTCMCESLCGSAGCGWCCV